MSATIHAGDLSSEELNDLVGRVRPAAPHTVLQRVDAIAFPSPGDPWVAAEWEEGRVFGDTLELHWARQGTLFRAVLTSEQVEDYGLGPGERLDGCLRRDCAYYLWGKDDARIGRSMEYRSIPGQGRAQVVVAEFYDEAGSLFHWRYVRFRREGAP